MLCAYMLTGEVLCGGFVCFFKIYILFSRHSINKCFFLFSFLYTPTFFFWNAIYSVTLLSAVTSFDFSLIPGLLGWVIKCFFHLERLLCLWIDYTSSVARLLSVTACSEFFKARRILPFFSTCSSGPVHVKLWRGF